MKEIVNHLAHKFYSLYHLRYTLSKNLKFGKDMFYIVDIETTTKCTRKCWYCPNSKFDRGVHELPVELYEKIMVELNKIGWNGMIRPFLSGDPLCDGRMPELMKMTRKYLPHCNIILYTNGDLLTDELYDKLIPYVDGFLVTDHGNFNKNLPKRPKIIVRKLENFKLCERGGLVDIEKERLAHRRKKCYTATDTLTVYWNGDVILCCNDYFGKVSFGNIKDEGIMDIWKNQNSPK